MTFKAGGSYLKLDPSGVTLVGPSINLNAGVSASKGTAAAALIPKVLAVSNMTRAGKVPMRMQAQNALINPMLTGSQLQRHAMLNYTQMKPSDSSLTSTQISLTPERIAIAGSQYDNSSGNKMMFIAQAVRELAEFKRNKPSLTRTLVLFTPSYNDRMILAARLSAIAYGADFVKITTAQELFDYLNRGKDRKQSPIEHLSMFSHGVPYQIAFGYELAGDLQMSLDMRSYNQISPSAFSSTAQIDSYACRTGMGNRTEFFPQTDKSLAQLLANHLQIKVRAFVRRSDYKNTWGSFEERQLGKLCSISNNMTPDNEWCKRWEQLAMERQEHNDDFNFTYQNIGAINPVISGSSPFGAPGGYFEFLPK